MLPTPLLVLHSQQQLQHLRQQPPSDLHGGHPPQFPHHRRGSSGLTQSEIWTVGDACEGVEKEGDWRGGGDGDKGRRRRRWGDGAWRREKVIIGMVTRGERKIHEGLLSIIAHKEGSLTMEDMLSLITLELPSLHYPF